MRLKILLGVVAVFGLLGLSFIGHHGHHTCPIAAISGNDCPSVNNVLALAVHHLSGLQNLTRAIITGAGPSAFFALMLVLFTLILMRLLGQISLPPLSYQPHRKIEKPTFRPNWQFLYWLALRNKQNLQTALGA